MSLYHITLYQIGFGAGLQPMCGVTMQFGAPIRGLGRAGSGGSSYTTTNRAD